MNYRIIDQEEFRIVGAKLSTTMQNDECQRAIPQFWTKTTQEGLIPRLCTQIDTDIKGVLGVTVGDWHTQNEMDYYIAVASTLPTPEGLEAYTVPASKWAVFESVGPMPHAIQEMQRRIVTEWLPASGYEYGNAPDVEVYTEGDQSAADYVCYVWLPITKK